ncbi:hypothetical protein [Amycolatopsis anabasis]|uniref:hypothetical protein n=1 Tax=Amycolatopsis anabasis TaxID=1840409 RepID=UPI00131E0C0E|nr:hypothetical protein [Amycolatopsis anabasis]
MTAALATLNVRLADAINGPEGGFSVSPLTGHDVRSGYAVSLHPDRERQIGGKVTPEDIRDFAYDNAAVLMAGGVVLGGWRDDNGVSYLDITTIVYDREEALALGRKYGQIAIWDFARGASVKVQGE